MRERARAKNRENKNEKSRKPRKIANGTRRLAHREKYRCAGTTIALNVGVQRLKSRKVAEEGSPPAAGGSAPRRAPRGSASGPAGRRAARATAPAEGSRPASRASRGAAAAPRPVFYTILAAAPGLG